MYMDHEQQSNPNQDPMTQLLNREGFGMQLDAFVEQRPGDVSVAFIDLDGLKKVNDTFGHAAGNTLISAAAKAITHSVRTDESSRPPEELDTVATARLSGDEFAIAFAGVDNEVTLSEIIGRIRTSLDEAGVKASIGGAVHQHEETPAELLARADKAMYVDKVARKKAIYEDLPLRKRVAAKLGGLMLKYADVEPPR